MFQPQPTPFAASCFASYGLAPNLNFGYSPSAGGGGGGGTSPGLLYGSQSLPQQQAQTQPPPPPPPQQQRASLPHRQLSTSSATSSSPFASSTASNTSPPPHTPSSCNTPAVPHHQLQPLPHHQQIQHQIQPQQQPRQTHQSYRSTTRIVVPKMEEDPSQQHDIAAQQAAAKDYQIIHKGPLVGNRVSSDAITTEYAKADPVYVEKTIALPQTYSHYRRIQGDGNCGWRAIGFSYFEKLIESGDQDKVEGEIARLMSFEPMLRNVGGYEYFDDFAEEMLNLLREISQSMENLSMAHLLLLERWNDASITASIIYYLRLLAATYLKANAATYDPFLAEVNGGVTGYCSQTIEMVDREIEHLGIVALVNTLLEPVDFVLQIVYLDRSPGSQANTYRFPESANNQDIANLGPIVYLLYRPDHYDILYRAPPQSSLPLSVQIPTAPVSMQINRVGSFYHNTAISSTQSNLSDFSSGQFGSLDMIPNFSSMGGFGGLMPPLPSNSSQPEAFSPAPVQQAPWMSQFPERLGNSTAKPPQPPPPIMATPQSTSPSPPVSTSSGLVPSSTIITTSGLGSRVSMGPPLAPAQAVSRSSSQTSSSKSTSGYHIRFSPVQLDYEESKSSIEPHFNVKTNTFKNSIWNRAHYGNPDFHPEEWSPDDEHIDGRVGGKRRFKKEPSS
ncbi:peptidase C65 Otubain-domain-containing protein [Mariannaea sp. PMI_226]|nr:peptidase C65 Otubain-domain-containing protein [Mariannaea sp. PMI_226]